MENMEKKVEQIKSIVIIENHDLYVGTLDISHFLKVEHRSLTRLVKKYQNEFDSCCEGLTATRLRQVRPKMGKPFDEYLLNESQSVYLTTLLTNTEQVRKFKLHLSKEFVKQRKLLCKLLAQKENIEWLEKRKSGKIERREETDEIKKFIEYAKEQGSSHSEKYYILISKMENTALFNIELLKSEYSNVRDMVSGMALDALKMADRIVAKALRDGMAERKYYKDIFRTAKARVESFAESMGKIVVGYQMKKDLEIDHKHPE